eukprot:10040236-Heterocapsa_arctica.AAC.1
MIAQSSIGRQRAEHRRRRQSERWRNCARNSAYNFWTGGMSHAAWNRASCALATSFGMPSDVISTAFDNIFMAVGSGGRYDSVQSTDGHTQ